MLPQLPCQPEALWPNPRVLPNGPSKIKTSAKWPRNEKRRKFKSLPLQIAPDQMQLVKSSTPSSRSETSMTSAMTTLTKTSKRRASSSRESLCQSRSMMNRPAISKTGRRTTLGAINYVMRVRGGEGF